MPKHPIQNTLLFALMLSFAACNNAAQSYITLSGSMLGTSYHVKAQIAPEQIESLSEQIESLDARMKREMSIFDPSSLLSRINRNECDSLSPWLERNIRLADSVSRLSHGLYDITVAPLVVAYGFGRERREEHPNIDSLMQFVGYEGLTIEGGRVAKRDPRMQIDLNSTAKGFAVDQMAEIVERLGAENYMVDIGGELRVKGVNPAKKAWVVGVESPIDGNMTDGELLQQRLHIEPQSTLRGVATSGNYRRFYTDIDGKKVVHTIDPTDGSAAPSQLLSVTVFAPTCALADAYATMFMAAGDSRAEGLAREIENCEVYFIYNNARAHEGESQYRCFASEGMTQRLLD